MTRDSIGALVCLALAVVAPTVDGAVPPPPQIEVAGWRPVGEVRTFGPEDLYQHIDGAAELYLSYGFRGLTVAEYSNENGGLVTVEVYRHPSPAAAFGIYAQERPREGHYLEVGAEGYLEPPILNLLVGDAYVKLSADAADDEAAGALQAFARATAEALGGEDCLPAPLALFPAEGKRPHSEGYAVRDLLGYAFLGSGFTAEYRVDGSRFRLFLIPTDDDAAASERLHRYLQACGDPPSVVPGTRLVDDPYHGPVGVVTVGRFVGGVVGLQDDALRQRYLSALEAGLEEAP